MVREYNLGGLKNALERGESLEKAKQTFITAGYVATDVEEAAAFLSKKEARLAPSPPAVPLPLPAAPAPMISAPPTAAAVPIPSVTAQPTSVPPLPATMLPKKKKTGLLIAIIAVAVMIIALLLGNCVFELF